MQKEVHFSWERVYGYNWLLNGSHDAKTVGIHCDGCGYVCSRVRQERGAGGDVGTVAAWAPHSPKSLEHICSMRPSALCSISHWAQILVTEERVGWGWGTVGEGIGVPRATWGAGFLTDQPLPLAKPLLPYQEMG